MFLLIILIKSVNKSARVNEQARLWEQSLFHVLCPAQVFIVSGRRNSVRSGMVAEEFLSSLDPKLGKVRLGVSEAWETVILGPQPTGAEGEGTVAEAHWGTEPLERLHSAEEASSPV